MQKWVFPILRSDSFLYLFLISSKWEWKKKQAKKKMNTPIAWDTKQKIQSCEKDIKLFIEKGKGKSRLSMSTKALIQDI